MDFRKIIFVVGPTGVGKTAVVYFLAKRLKGEIVSCDSMQVYKEISIVNNKPSKEILKSVPHHLINIVSVTKDFDVVQFRRRTLRTLLAINRKNRIPIISGGSGLYMKVLLDGIFENSARNLLLRKKLEHEADKKGSAFLYEQLREKDPQAADKIHPHDTRRIIRALEVFIINKKPISELQKRRQGIWGKFDISIFALNRDRSELYQIINNRVEDMFKEGALQEVRRLQKKKLSKTAAAIIGVKEIRGFLNGEYDLERTKYLIKLNTRHYAKRQLTWFRRDTRLKWINVNKEATPKEIASTIIKEI